MMSRFFLLIVFFSLSLVICKGQNLVPNPSFEDTVYCPTTLTLIDAAAGWSSGNAIGTSDYYNTCSPPGIAPPNTLFAFQYPFTGNAYAGIIPVNYQLAFPDYREYIVSQLISALQPGTKYFVSFYVNRGYGIQQHYILATNKFGVLFSTIAFGISNPAPENNFAHVYSDSIITDTLSWTQIKGSFIADSAYQYITIGNFFDNAHTDTLNFGDTIAYSSYYLIDNVCVSSDSLICYTNVGIDEVKNKEEIILFPNPFTNTINITAKETGLVEITLFDLTSRKVLIQSFKTSTVLNTEPLAKGLYIYEIRSKDRVIKKGKILKD